MGKSKHWCYYEKKYFPENEFIENPAIHHVYVHAPEYCRNDRFSLENVTDMNDDDDGVLLPNPDYEPAPTSRGRE